MAHACRQPRQERRTTTPLQRFRVNTTRCLKWTRVRPLPPVSLDYDRREIASGFRSAELLDRQVDRVDDFRSGRSRFSRTTSTSGRCRKRSPGSCLRDSVGNQQNGRRAPAQPTRLGTGIRQDPQGQARTSDLSLDAPSESSTYRVGARR